MDKVLILDTTLRDGEQAPFVIFTLDEKIRIAKKLDELGVDIIEAGIPAMGSTEMDSISAIIGLKTCAQILTWNRLDVEDIKKSIECGAKNVHLAVPASDLHIREKLNQTRAWVLKTIQSVVDFAVSKGLSVSVGAEDASRADRKFLKKLYCTAIKAGATRVRYADTVGIQEAFGAYDEIKQLKEYIDRPLDYHGHNDFGMATANAFSAYRAGADVISCTVNGLGERAGNTPLEEFVMTLKHIARVSVNIKTEKLQEISQLVEVFSRRRVNEGKAIVGSQVYCHESGIHVDGLLKDMRTYQPFPPEDAGAATRFVFGKFSGENAIAFFCKQKGYKNSESERRDFLKVFREAYRNEKKIFPEQFLEEYFKANA